jgi:hypothetical protein
VDIDHITDINELRKAAKMFRVKMKKDYLYKDPFGEGYDYLFKAGQWYPIEQDQFGIRLFSDEMDTYESFTYEGAAEYMCEI